MEILRLASYASCVFTNEEKSTLHAQAQIFLKHSYF